MRRALATSHLGSHEQIGDSVNVYCLGGLVGELLSVENGTARVKLENGSVLETREEHVREVDGQFNVAGNGDWAQPADGEASNVISYPLPKPTPAWVEELIA